MTVGRRTARGGVVLRHEYAPGDSRSLEAHMIGGDLVFEGYDSGHGVSDVFGTGITSYEWVHTVRAADVPRAREVLELGPGDLLERLAEQYGGDRAHEIYKRLHDAGVPIEHFSWHS